MYLVIDETIMKIILKTIVLFVLVLFASGCAAPYWKDRGKDATDVFTFCQGIGGGARARVGPFHAGLLIHLMDAGLRGGEIGNPSGRGTGVIEILCISKEDFGAYSGDGYFPRGKSYKTADLFPFITTDLESNDIADYEIYPYNYYTQCEVIAGVGMTFRLGFNPGELIDFLLGFTTYDMFNDDLSHLKLQNQNKKIKEEESNKGVSANLDTADAESK